MKGTVKGLAEILYCTFFDGTGDGAFFVRLKSEESLGGPKRKHNKSTVAAAGIPTQETDKEIRKRMEIKTPMF